MPTIRDVARKLNISTTTVSRALDGYHDVSEETRQLVIQTSQEMNYSPNRAARQLRRNKAETIGFIIPYTTKRFDAPFFMEFISGLGSELSGGNYDLLVANALTEQAEQEIYQRWVNSHKVDGFILNRLRRIDWRVSYLSQAKVPFVSLEKSEDAIDYPYIYTDGSKGYDELVNHVIMKGFSHFSFLGGIEQLVVHAKRLKWFETALQKFNLSLDSEDLVLTNMTSNGGYEAASHLLSRNKRPDALICVSDEIAYGAIHAAHEHGLEVGKEVAIAGFEGLRDSIHTEPPLTTLDIPISDIAARLVRMLLTLLNGEEIPEQERVVNAELIIRGSTSG